MDLCFAFGKEGKERVLQRLKFIVILNKKHHVAITSSMKPLPLKKPCVLSLKCGTLQSRATHPWAHMGKAHGQTSPSGLFRREDTLLTDICEWLHVWTGKLTAVQRTHAPLTHNKVIYHFYLQRQNPHLMQWWMASLLNSTVLRCCRNNAAHFHRDPKAFCSHSLTKLEVVREIRFTWGMKTVLFHTSVLLPLWRWCIISGAGWESPEWFQYTDLGKV